MTDDPNDSTKPTLFEIATAKSVLAIAVIAVVLLAWATGLIRL